MKVQDIMSRPAMVVGPETSIQDVAQIMGENLISGLPVVNQDGELLGTVTELDLIVRNAPLIGPSYLAVLSGLIPTNLKQYSQYRHQLRQILATTASQLMDENAKWVEPTTDLEEVMSLMVHPEITLLPVVENNKVIGVVTRTNLVQLIESLEAAAEPETTQT